MRAEKIKEVKALAQKKQSAAVKEELAKQNENQARQDKVLWSTIFFITGLLAASFTLFTGESVWKSIHNVMLGLFGLSVYLVPIIMIYVAVMIALDKSDVYVSARILQCLTLLLLLSGFVQIVFSGEIQGKSLSEEIIPTMFADGKKLRGGGVISIIIAGPLLALFKKTGAIIIIVLLLLAYVMIMANKTFVDLIKIIHNSLRKSSADRAERYVSADDFIPPPGAKKTAPNQDVPAVIAKEKQKFFNIDIPMPKGKRAEDTAAEKVQEPTAAKTADTADFTNPDFPIKSPAPIQKNPRLEADKELEKEKLKSAAGELDDIIKRAAAAPVKPNLSRADCKESNPSEAVVLPFDVDDKNAKNKAAENYEKPLAEETMQTKQTAQTAQTAQTIQNTQPTQNNQNNQSSQNSPSSEKPVLPKRESIFGKKQSTLASEKLSTDEELDIPDAPTAADIQHEIAENKKQPVVYNFPPIALLKAADNARNAVDAEAEMKSNADTLVDTLKSFGVQTRIVDIHRGPTVTRYELQPSAGVKISKITALADDIALNLAAAGVRIEAPIPGKAAVGIEVPNRVKDTVSIREMIESAEFAANKSKLSFVVGKNIDGDVIIGDIGKMPHVIIAGTTGSGKSVCTNSIIMSILYNATPDEVRLVLIDPKMVEFKSYDGIPHLLIPVVTDPRKAAGALSWAVQEMLKRYKLFADKNVRDLKDYNEMAAETDGVEPLPRIVIIIDELADLMMACANEVEDSICRLAQMARAAGMHLIIATQRPTVDVITGLIKANIPSRIALTVSSQIDSRTIIDTAGAEKLLGYGDMLYYPQGIPKPIRIQGCFVSTKEVEAVVEFIRNGGGTVEYSDEIMQEIEKATPAQKGDKPSDSGADVPTGDGSDEELIDRAVDVLAEAGQASVSYLQRKLKLGYARAARIMDQLEELGIVGPYEGSKPRAVLVTKEMWLQRKLLNQDVIRGNNDTEE